MKARDAHRRKQRLPRYGRRDQPETQTLERTITLDRAALDEAARTVPASLSSETPVERWFGTEVLRHTVDAVDLTRTERGLPLLWQHDPDQLIGRIHDVKIHARRLTGVLHFATNARANEVWDDVRGGFLNDVSIKYKVHQWHEDNKGNKTAIRWAPLEGSVVSVPGDPSVGINRSQQAEDPNMPEPTQPNANSGGEPNPPPAPAPGAPNPPAAPAPVQIAEFQAARSLALTEGRAEGVRLEAERRDGINAMFAAPRFNNTEYIALREECLRTGASVEHSRTALLELIGRGTGPLVPPANGEHSGQRVEAGDDQRDQFSRGAQLAIECRAGICTDEKERAAARENPYYGMTLSEVAREYTRSAGIEVRGQDRKGIVGLALTRDYQAGHGTSDFANLLANVANKSLRQGYDQAPETWRTWCAVGSFNDFKAHDLINTSGFSELDEIPETGEYKQGTMSDLKEQIRLATYGKLFNISRQLIINDDLNALSRRPIAMGNAAARKIGDLVYSTFLGNPTLGQDGKEVFHADHDNLAASGAAPGVNTLEAGWRAMATQEAPAPSADEAGHRLNVRPRYLLVPVALEISAATLVASQYDPAGTAGTLKPNPWNNRFTVVSDARLDDNSTTAWYLAAAQGAVGTVLVGFLDGVETPFMDEQDGWTVDGRSYKVRIDAGVTVEDYRGLYKNPGA